MPTSFSRLLQSIAMLLLTSPAHASFLHGEALDTMADVMSWVVLPAPPPKGIPTNLLERRPDLIAAEQSLAQRCRRLEANLDEQQRLREIDTARVRIGSRDSRTLHSREQLLLATRMRLVQTRSAQLNQRISTVLALGGGWE